MEISKYGGDNVIRDLTEGEMDLFKELLIAMDGMDRVTIYLSVSYCTYELLNIEQM